MGNPLQGEQKASQGAFLGQPNRKLSFAALNRDMQADWQNQAVFPRPFSYGGRFPGGTVDVPIPSRGGGGTTTSAPNPPWTPYFTQDGGGNQQANFYPGTIGGVLPSNMFTPLALDQTHLNYAFVIVTASAGVVTGASLSASTTYPTLPTATTGSPPTSFNVPVGIFDCSVSPVKCYNLPGFGNIWTQPYVTQFTAAATASILTPPFTASYNWEWGAGV